MNIPYLDVKFLDLHTLGLMLIVLAALGLISIASWLLRSRSEDKIDNLLLDKFRSKVNGWWLLFAFVAAAAVLGQGVVVFLFGAMSFWAMREFVTLTPTRQADHRALFLLFFFCIPLQYVFVWLRMYAVYSVLIPAYIFLFIPMIIAAFGDTKFYLTRITQISVSLLICVYSLSFAPALITLELPEGVSGSNVSLLCFFLLMTQISEIFPILCNYLLPSQHGIAPDINTSKTWEGFLASLLGTSFVGTLLYWATPFPFWVAGGIACATAFMAFGGTLTLSAIKRDRGVQDYGTLVLGHGGILDRIDSICFAAPVFYHLTLIYLHYGMR